MVRHTGLVSLFALVSMLGGCSQGDDVNIGEGTPETLGSALSHYEGQWDGYTEAFQFTDGSDRFRLTLDEEGQGTVVFGNASAPAPATNPDVGYPVGVSHEDLVYRDWRNFVPGLAYPVLNASVQANRLRIQLNALALYEDWCAMQTPMLLQESTYSCKPPGAFQFGATGCSVTQEETTPIDCGKLALCLPTGPCACTETACEASDPRIVFDAAFGSEGTELVGSLVGDAGNPGAPRITTRLSKD